MPTYTEVGTGAVGINWSKDSPSQPDYRGKFELNGKNYTISAWKKFRKEDGREFFSFNISEVHGEPSKSDAMPPVDPPKRKGGHISDLDDDIPF